MKLLLLESQNQLSLKLLLNHMNREKLKEQNYWLKNNSKDWDKNVNYSLNLESEI